jgi:hypothetical protein
MHVEDEAMHGIMHSTGLELACYIVTYTTVHFTIHQTSDKYSHTKDISVTQSQGFHACLWLDDERSYAEF